MENFFFIKDKFQQKRFLLKFLNSEKASCFFYFGIDYFTLQFYAHWFFKYVFHRKKSELLTLKKNRLF